MDGQVQLIQISTSELTNIFLAGVDKRIEDLKNSYQPKEPKKYLSRKETAEYLGVSLVTLHHWKKKSILVPKGIGNKVMYLLSDIESKIIDLK